MTETLAYEYASVRVLSESYPINTNSPGFRWIFENRCVLVIWMNVALALEGLILHNYLSIYSFIFYHLCINFLLIVFIHIFILLYIVVCDLYNYMISLIICIVMSLIYYSFMFLFVYWLIVIVIIWHWDWCLCIFKCCSLPRVGAALMAVWSKVPPLTASYLSPLHGFESWPRHVRKLPVTWS